MIGKKTVSFGYSLFQIRQFDETLHLQYSTLPYSFQNGGSIQQLSDNLAINSITFYKRTADQIARFNGECGTAWFYQDVGRWRMGRREDVRFWT